MESDPPLKLKSTPEPRMAPAQKTSGVRPANASSLDDSVEPVPLCNRCGEPLNTKGQCAKCQASAAGKSEPRAATTSSRSAIKPVPPLPDDSEILDLEPKSNRPAPAAPKPAAPPKPKAKAPPLPPMPGGPKPAPKAGTQSPKKKPPEPADPGEDEFWKMLDE